MHEAHNNCLSCVTLTCCRCLSSTAAAVHATAWSCGTRSRGCNCVAKSLSVILLYLPLNFSSMWRRGAAVLAAVLAAKTHQRCHVLADAGMPLPASLHTTSQHLEYASTTTASSGAEPVGLPSTQSLQPGPSSNSSSSSSSSSSSGKAIRWPPSLKEGTHFAVLTGDGVPARLSSIVAAMQQADVSLLGEYHDDPVAHALQLELLKRAADVLGYQLPAQLAASAATRDSKGDAQTSSGPAAGTPADSTAAENLQQQQQGAAVAPPQRPLVLSLEMFERDVQPVLDEYVAGTASLADLVRDARPWPNYRRDYQPLVDFCKGLATLHNNSTAATAAPSTHGTAHSSASDAAAPEPSSSSSSGGSSSSMVRVVAANAPRRYVSLAGRAGRQALLQLPPASQAFLAPLPYAQPSQAYVAKVTGSMRQAAADMPRHRERERLKQQGDDKQQQQQQQQQAQPEQQPAPTSSTTRHNTPATAADVAAADGGACPYIGFNVSSNFLDAQCLWDSTMAHSIAQQLAAACNTATCGIVAGQATSATTAAISKGSTAASSTADTAVGSTVNGSTTVRYVQPTSSTSQQQQQQDPLVIHLCGKFHAEHRLGIPEHLQLYVPGVRVLVVTFVPTDSMAMYQQQFDAAGLKGSADFVVLTDGNLPRSFASVHPV